MTHPNPAYYGDCPSCHRPLGQCVECGARADEDHAPWCEQAEGWMECPVSTIVTAKETRWEPAESEDVCCVGAEED